jgi:4-hydroxybenzoate polyprenyltransferase
MALSFGRYTPLLLAGTAWLSVALLSPTFSALDAWLGGIALLAALVHLMLPLRESNDTDKHTTEFNLANVSSSISIAASLTIVVVFLLQ